MRMKEKECSCLKDTTYLGGVNPLYQFFQYLVVEVDGNL